jgi:hypothetical protein
MTQRFGTWLTGFGSSRLVVKLATGRAGLRRFQLGIIAVERGTIGADFFVVITKIDEYVRVIKRDICANAHEFLHANFNGRVACVILKMGNCMASHCDYPRRSICSVFGATRDIIQAFDGLLSKDFYVCLQLSDRYDVRKGHGYEH